MNGTRLRRLRRQAGVSQAALAKQLGVATNTVWRWEAGQVPISVPMGKLITVVTRTVVHPTGHEMRRGQR